MEMLSVCRAEQLWYAVWNWALLWISACEQKLQHTGVCHRHRWDLAVPEVRKVGTGEI